jgi:multiple sugar transport system substrate-binding protein
MLRRRVALARVAASVPVVAAACGGETQTPAPARKAGEKITLRHVPWPGIQASRDAQTAVVQAWNTANPDVQVVEEVLPGEGSHYQKLQIQAAANTLPDLTFMQGSNDYVSFVVKDLLLPIDAAIKKDRSFNQQERLHPRSRDIVELNGHIWGLPVEAGTYVVFYNRAMFEQAGAPPPQPGWTWNDLLDRAKRLTREVGGTPVVGYGQGLNFGRTEPWIVQGGARILDKVAFPTKQRLDAPEVVAAVQFVHELAWKHGAMATGRDAGTQGLGLWQGQHAMRQEGNWLMPDLGKNMKAPWAMAPLPKGKQAATWMSIDVNVAFKPTKYPEEAYRFLKFINNEGQTPMIEQWGRMPVTLNEAHKQTYVKYCKGLGVENWQVAWDAWEQGYSSHLTPAWPDLDREVLTPAFNKLFGADGASANVATLFKELAPVAQRILDTAGQPPKQ